MSDTNVDVVADQDDIEEELDAVETPEGDEIGPAGQQAIERSKAKERKARAVIHERNATIAALQAQIDAASKTPDEQALDAARREERTAVLAVANAKLVKAEIRAAAKGVLADPADALAFLDASSFEVNDDGEVDSEAISEAIADLLKRKPHLAAERKGPVVPKDSIDQGPRDKAAPDLKDLAKQALSNRDISKSISLTLAAHQGG